MSGVVERRWVSLLDSAVWRSLGRSRLGASVLDSRAYRYADTMRRYAQTAVAARRRPETFASVEVLCLFLGPVKSGGSLMGALLDAHPRIVMADEADPMRYVMAGFRREQIFHLLAKSARREVMKGRVTARRLEPYSLAVAGWSQGVVDEPIVMGDTRAGPTTRLLGDRPELIDRLREVLGDVADRYVHVVRNPFDPISAMVLRGKRTIENAVTDFAAQCRRLAVLRERIEPDRLLTVRYEELVRSPGHQIDRVCRFLGVTPPSGYLEACAAIVDPSRPGERTLVDWSPPSIARVERLAVEFPLLEGYAYRK